MIFEASDGVGGTWRANTYPGAACDVPSHLYSYSFALKPDWTKTYAEQAEILRYFEDCADRFGIRPHLRTGTRITGARWDEGARRWHLTDAAGGAYDADVLVSAIGTFTTPFVPDIDGLGSFEGPCFHSARWEHEHDLSGAGWPSSEREPAPPRSCRRWPRCARSVSVFQRTPQWILPRSDKPFTEAQKRRFARNPIAARRHRREIYWAFENTITFRHGDEMAEQLKALALSHIDHRIHDDRLRAKLTPDYPFGCKRTLVCSAFYKALTRDNVELVTERIERVTPGAIVTEDGRERAVDAIVLATGFEADRVPRGDRRGGRGRPSPARRLVRGGARLPGPHGVGLPELLHALRPQHEPGRQLHHRDPRGPGPYVLSALRAMRRRRAHAVDVRRDVMDTYNARAGPGAGRHGVERRMPELLQERQREDRHPAAPDVPAGTPSGHGTSGCGSMCPS